MSQKIKSIFLAGLPAIVITTFLAAVVIYAWSEPSSPPPSGNVSAPLNVSGAGQSKLGALTVSGGFESTGITLLGTGGANVGIGTTNPTTGKLVVSGGNVDVSGNRITNVGMPTLGTDAANRDYVDAAGGGYTYCYIIAANNNTISCAVDETTYISTSGTGCVPEKNINLGNFGVWKSNIVTGFHCDGSASPSTNDRYECLRLLSGSSWQNVSGEAYCSAFKDISITPSTIAICCK